MTQKRGDSNFCAPKADMPKGPQLDEKSAFKEIENRLHLSLPSWDQSLKAMMTRRAIASFLPHHALISEKRTVGRRDGKGNPLAEAFRRRLPCWWVRGGYAASVAAIAEKVGIAFLA